MSSLLMVASLRLIAIAMVVQWVFWPLNSRADITYTFTGDGSPFQQFTYTAASFVTVDESLLASQLTSSTDCIVNRSLPCVGFYIDPSFAPFPSDVITFTSPYSGKSHTNVPTFYATKNVYYFPAGVFEADGTYSVLPFTFNKATLVVSGTPTPEGNSLVLFGAGLCLLTARLRGWRLLS